MNTTNKITLEKILMMYVEELGFEKVVLYEEVNTLLCGQCSFGYHHKDRVIIRLNNDLFVSIEIDEITEVSIKAWSLNRDNLWSELKHKMLDIHSPTFLQSMKEFLQLGTNT